MKKFLLILMPSLLCTMAGFATNVSGIISTNATWTKANSPYIVTGDIDIDTNALLTIEPGVTIKVDGNYTIYVDGIIKALGTGSDNILFTSNRPSPAMGNWKGIVIRRMISTDTLVFDHCHFQYADNAIYSDGFLRIVNSKFDNNQFGINALQDAVINECVFLNNHDAIYVTGNNDITVVNSDIAYNVNGFSGGGYLAHNKIHHNSYGVTSGGKNIVIYDNEIAYNTESGIVNTQGSITFNQIWYNGVGIQAPISTYIAHNGIKYNETGVLVVYNYPGQIEYNCIEQNSKYNFKNSDVNLMDMSNNYWGASDSATVMTKIFDYYSDFSKGKTILTPLLQSEDSGCAATIDIPTTGIKETAIVNDVKIYPNPANTNFKI